MRPRRPRSIVSENRSLDPARVQQIMEQTATDLGAPGKDSFYGSGLINPRAAVAAALPGLNNGTEGHGYWIVGADGRVFTYGSARNYGDLSHTPHPGVIVAGARTPTGRGYWLAGNNGSVYSFGDARVSTAR